MHDSRELVSSFLLVLYLCGKTFYSIRVCSLLFPPSPFLGLIFGLCFWSASVSDLWLISESCWCWFLSCFVGLLYLAKVVDLSLIQAFLPSKVYADFSSF